MASLDEMSDEALAQLAADYKLAAPKNATRDQLLDAFHAYYSDIERQQAEGMLHDRERGARPARRSGIHEPNA